jgi:hypothetical protein
VPLFKIFLFFAPALSPAWLRHSATSQWRDGFGLRAARHRSRIFERALQRIAFRAVALIFHEKCALAFANGRRSDIRVFELVLLTPMRLLPSRAWLVWFPLQPFTSNKKNKQQITGGKRGNRTTRSALVTAHGGAPGPIADSATLRG